MSSARRPRVAIIGAGFGGTAMAVNLKRSGIDDFVVFEQSPAPGGVWWDNTYPGCQVDVPSQLYCFSFYPYDWTRTHASRPELQRYMEDTLDHFAIRRKFRFSCSVQRVTWDEQQAAYTVELASGEQEQFDAVVSCVGLLNRAILPDWPGIDSFAGPKFHTSQWEDQHDLRGKTVALVGTGSTGIQVTPHLAETADHLYIYQREPGWIIPKLSREFRPWTRRLKRRLPFVQRIERFGWWLVFDLGLRDLFRTGSWMNRKTEEMCRSFIEKRIEDPEVRALVTPDYPLGCKRPMFDDAFYRALNRDNVTLVPHTVTEVTETGVIDADGTERPADVLITATGFQAQDYLASLQVQGSDGRELHEVWDGEPRAFLGVTVPGFPNFFILNGPNTNGGNSIVFLLERQAEMVARALGKLEPGYVIDTPAAVHEGYDSWVMEQLRKRYNVVDFCNNYYHAPSGRNVTQWPRGGFDYSVLTRVLPALTMRTRPARHSAPSSAAPTGQRHAAMASRNGEAGDGGSHLSAKNTGAT